MNKLATTLFMMLLAPSLSARTIKTPLNLKYFELGSEGKPDRYLGFTSPKSKAGVSVPAHERWYAYPAGSYRPEDWDRLADDLRRLAIPGLDLSDRWDFTNERLAAFQGIPTLHILFLARTKITDAGLARVGAISGLEQLTLSPQISDAGVAHLKNLKRLRRLELHGARISDKALATLKDLPVLEKIDLSGTAITDHGARLLGSIASLREVDVSETAITDKGAAYLAKLPQLKTFYLPRGVTDATIKRLAQLKKLQSLDVSGSGVTEAGVVMIAQWPALRELSLSGTRVGNTALLYLSRMKNLRTLELSETGISGEGFSGISGFSRLETLGLSWGNLTESEIRALGALPRLTQVVLNGWTLSEAVLTRIRAMAKIKKSESTQVAMRPSVPHQPPKKTLGAMAGELTIPALHEATPRPASRISEPSGTRPSPMSLSGERPAIALEEPRGPGMEIEVGAAPAAKGGKRLVGLKRLHQMELSQGPRDIDLAPGASPQIAGPDESPANSVGEIEVGVPSKKRR